VEKNIDFGTVADLYDLYVQWDLDLPFFRGVCESTNGDVYLGDGGDDELAGAERAGLRAGRAAWFVSHSMPTGTWPELLDCEAALRFVDERS
jgi:hypothetical protein